MATYVHGGDEINRGDGGGGGGGMWFYFKLQPLKAFRAVKLINLGN